MRPDGPSPNFVLVDLSKLGAASAAAFLAEWAPRTGNEGFPQAGICHWIVDSARVGELLNASGPGPEFLRQRLARGDRIFCPNPTGLDWTLLFPSEAEAELQALTSLVPEASVFLENTSRAQAGVTVTVFRPAPEGLWVTEGAKTTCLPWASKDRRGVWWIVPGQALLSGLPPLPWQDLTVHAATLLSRATGSMSADAEAPSPASKLASQKIALLRRSPTSALHQSVLYRSPDFPGLGTKEAVDFEEALGGIRKRSLVANMQGQTVLTEAGFRLRFQGGRLVRIEDTDGDVLGSATSSYMEWDGARHRFAVNSAFSFEGDYSWGLRQSLVLNHEALSEPGRAILDYYFVEESREFFVAATVRWPRWKVPVTVQKWALLELTLFDLPRTEPLTTRVVWPDGRSHDSIQRGQASGVLEGTDFVFASGARSLVLGFPQNQTPRPHLLPWKLARGWAKSRLVVNPEGGNAPRPSSEFEGVEEHFSFYLTRGEGAKLPFSVTRKQAVELIPPYVLQS